MIRVIVADDEEITRKGLSMLPWVEEGFEVVGLAENGLKVLDMVDRLNPDLLLTDIRMPGLSGMELMDQLQSSHPELKFVFITAYHQMEYALKAIEMGAVGFVLKPTDPDEIMQACRKAAQQIEQERKRRLKEQEIRSQLREYSLTLQGTVLPEGEEDSTRKVVREIIRTLEERYMEELTIQRIAQQYHFHPDHIGRLIRQETGDCFSNILTRIRLQKAVELLGDPEIKVYEIAEKVGIHDSRYFGQLFKKHYGMTPKDFRKRNIPGSLKGDS